MPSEHRHLDLAAPPEDAQALEQLLAGAFGRPREDVFGDLARLFMGKLERMEALLTLLASNQLSPPPIPADDRLFDVEYGGDRMEACDYEQMRAQVQKIGQMCWQIAGQPLDPSWPAAAADELSWVDAGDGKREIPLPDGTTITVQELPF